MKKYTPLFIVLLIVLLATIKTWIVFYINEYLICFIADLLIVYLGSKNLRSTTFSISIMVLSLIASMLYVRGNINAYMGGILVISPFILFCFLRRDIRLQFLLFFNKVFAVIMTISVTCWILFLLGFSMPHSFITYSEYYLFDNYYTFLDFHNIDGIVTFFPRFCSIIIEPGDLACILALLIFLDGYRLKKWYNIIYLLSLVLTFSLAGFLLFAIGLIPHVLYSSKKNKVGIILVVIAIVLAANYSINSSENSIAYQMFGQRLVMDDGSGKISGYNRSSDDFDFFFWHRFWGSGNELYGYGDKLQYGGVDMKVFIAKFGLVSLMAYFVFLAYVYMKRKSKFGLWYFVLFFMIFYKGYSMLFYSGMLMIYLVGIEWCYLYKEKNIGLWPSKPKNK